MNPTFCELLLRAELLANGTMTLATPQPLERSLADVLQEAKELHTRITKPKTQTDQKLPEEGAYTMLAPHGIDVQYLTEKVNNLKMYETFKPSQLPDTNVEAMLKNEVETAIISMITETNQMVFDKVRGRKKRSIYAEWTEKKQLLLTAINDLEQKEQSVTKSCPLQQTSQDIKSSESSLCGIQLLQAHELIRYNYGEKFSLLTRFNQLAQKHAKERDIPQMWSLLEHMVKKVDPPAITDCDALRTRQMAPQFLKQSCLYLEQCFMMHMFSTNSRSSHLINCNILTSVHDQVQQYVRFTCNQLTSEIHCSLLDVVNGRPLWPHVYYSIRCGDLNAAMQFLKDWGNIYPDMLELLHQLQMLDGNQVSKYEQLVETRCKMSLTLQYKNKWQHCSDPYQKVVFAILLNCCDPQESHSSVVHTIDDYLWLQLSVHHSLTHLSLARLQSVMSAKYGKQFLTDCTTMPVYFQLLVLTGHFEAAIEFLARKEMTRSHAVHMAIALSELRLIGTSSNRLASLLCGDAQDLSPVGRLNVVRLVITYAKEFELTNTHEALHYYYTLRKFKDSDGCSLMTKCIVDLLVENGCKKNMVEYIFGTSQSYDPSISCGGIYVQLPDAPCNKRALAGLVAAELVKRCDWEPAIRMYILARKLDKAMTLVSSLLARSLHLPGDKSSRHSLLCSLTNQVNVALAGSHKQPQPETEQIYTLLVQLMDFFTSYHAGKMLIAREVLRSCKLLPNTDSEVNACLHRIKQLGSHVQQVMPHLMLAAMHITHKEYQQNKQSMLREHSMLKNLREQAKALINLAATLPCRIPLETNRKLIQLEIAMQY